MTYSAVRASLHGELQGRGLGLVVRSGGTRRKTHSKDGLDDKAVELLERDFVRLGEALSKLLRLGRLAPRQGDLSELESTAKLRRRQLAAHLPAQRELTGSTRAVLQLRYASSRPARSLPKTPAWRTCREQQGSARGFSGRRQHRGSASRFLAIRP